jgi:hypothetical protein
LSDWALQIKGLLPAMLHAKSIFTTGKPVGRRALPVTYITPEGLLAHQRDDVLR